MLVILKPVLRALLLLQYCYGYCYHHGNCGDDLCPIASTATARAAETCPMWKSRRRRKLREVVSRRRRIAIAEAGSGTVAGPPSEIVAVAVIFA